MSVAIKFMGFFFLMLANASIDQTTNMVEINGMIVRLLAYLLAMIGSIYLAAELWKRAEIGSESWKYLCISMLMFTFWNIIMAFGIVINVLYMGGNINFVENSESIPVVLETLDPIIEVSVFIILLFGLRSIIKAMRDKPWTVFSKEESDE